MKLTFALLISLLSTFAFATASTTTPATQQQASAPVDEMTYQTTDDGQSFVYKKPTLLPFSVFSNFFKDYKVFYDDYFNEEHAPYIGAILGFTALGIYYDEDILLESQRLGRRWGIPSEDKTREKFTLFGYPARFPTDYSSAMYFLGDGWVHSAIALSFWGTGYFTSDYRAWSTGYQLMEGFLMTGVTVQTVKRTTGRESPVVRTQNGGVWRFFPNQADYNRDTQKYDAFYSGHLATATMTVTVLAENYPEYYMIRPVGYTLMGLLAFQMMNNGVHWFGDYPLALGIGYGFAKVISKNYRLAAEKKKAAKNSRWVEPTYAITPFIQDRDHYGLGLRVAF